MFPPKVHMAATALEFSVYWWQLDMEDDFAAYLEWTGWLSEDELNDDA